MNNETDRATPRPWVLNTEVDDVWIYGANGEPVYDDSEATGMEPLSKDDAALIVRAVNSHDALVAACSGLLRTILNHAPRLMESKWGPDSGEHGAVRKARAALALARGE